MQSVSLPHLTLRRPALGAGAALVAVAAAAAVVAWPGGARHEPAPAADFGGRIAGVPLQQADCAHWLRASASERTGTVVALRGTVGGASTSGGFGRTLTDARATALFDARCAQPGSGGFLLYEMYTRSAAFGG